MLLQAPSHAHAHAHVCMGTHAREGHILYPHQIEALEGLRGELRTGKRRIMLMGACGFGKTTVAAAMIKGATEKGKRSLFIADRKKLIDQASARLDSEGIEHGIIQADHWRTDYSKPVQVASIQTLARRSFPDFDLVIIDEAHVLHKAHIDLMCRWDNVPTIGLSATPWAKGLGKIFQGIVVAATTSELIEGGFLVRPRVFSHGCPDLDGVETRRGDYAIDQLGEAANRPKLVADVVQTWLMHGNGRMTIAFAVNVRHSMAIVEEFNRVGVRAEHVDGYMQQADVDAAFIRLRNKEIEILSSVDLASRGVDIPEVSCGIMARPTKSLMLHFQQQGRLIRAFPGKSDCIVLDHAGNTLRLGFITDDIPTELDDGRKSNNTHERKEPLPQNCPSCHATKQAKVRKCHECGFEPKAQPKAIECARGELAEVGKKRGTKIASIDRDQVYAELRGYAKRNGMKDGWAWYACRDLFGSAPRSKPAPVAPSYGTLRLIRHMNIKRAKARAVA